MSIDWSDDTAQWYLQKYGDHNLNRLWLEQIELSDNDFLLDVGCGGGASIKAALLKFPDLRAVGVDPSEVMINAAREALPRVDFYQTGAEELPLPGGVISVVLANCSVIHWPDLAAGLTEVFRVLKPSGQFLSIEESFASQSEDCRLKSPDDLPQHLTKCGFKILTHGRHDRDGESFWATLSQKP